VILFGMDILTFQVIKLQTIVFFEIFQGIYF